MSKAIKRSEDLARHLNAVAHDYEHVNNVRNFAVLIAREEGLNTKDIFLLEIAALWHDMALGVIDDRSKHGEEAGEMFQREFPNNDIFTEREKYITCFLLKYHDKARIVRNSKTEKELLLMLNIFTDADTLDLLGERGYLRAIEVVKANHWPEFDSQNPIGETFGFSATQFDERFELKKKGLIDFVKEPTLVGQLNFQISCADNLITKKGIEIGMPKADYLRKKVSELIRKNESLS